MKITGRPTTGPYWAATFSEGGTTIDLGLLDEAERDELAKEMLNAVFDLGPRGRQFPEWFAYMLEQCGIPLPTETEDTP